ncbi:MAG: hypothetical protein HMLKMBBP_00576 [Planctomycetes bacterium]|nr:hypothetical protein [Planctomycetota bacterium]
MRGGGWRNATTVPARSAAGIYGRVAMAAAAALTALGGGGCAQVAAAVCALSSGALDAEPRSYEYCAALILSDSPDNRSGALRRKDAPVRASKGSFTFSGGPIDTRPNGSRITLPIQHASPFRLESTIGLCEAEFAPDASAIFGVAVRDSANTSGPGGWWGVTCRVSGGLTATASFGSVGTVAFADATKLDIAFEHDGTDLVVLARDADAGGAWQELGREEAVFPSGSAFPEAFAGNLQPGAAVSIHDARFLANSTVGGGPGAQATRSVARATERFGAAEAALDSGSAEDAASALDDARDEIGDALAALGPPKRATAEERAAAKARKLLGKVQASLAKSAGLLRKKGIAKAKKARALNRKSLLSALTAGDLVLPEELREAVGGLRLGDVLRK